MNITVNDTVRVNGYTGTAVVDTIHANGTVDVTFVSRTGRDLRTMSVTIAASRATLVRHGNADDDMVAELFARLDGDAAILASDDILGALLANVGVTA